MSNASRLQIEISGLQGISEPSSDQVALLESKRQELNSQNAVVSELQNLSSSLSGARSLSDSVNYNNGLIEINGNTMTPAAFRTYVESLPSSDAKTILQQTMNYHLDLAAASKDYSDTQLRIEAIQPAVEEGVYLMDKATGLYKLDGNGKPIRPPGDLAHVYEVMQAKANSGYNEAKQHAEEKGDIKKDNK